MGLLCVHTYFDMRMYDPNYNEAGKISVIRALLVLITLPFVFIGERTNGTKFSKYWIVWIIFLLIDFVALGQGGRGASNIFHASFCAFLFLFFFKASQYFDKVEMVMRMGFLLAFAIAFYFSIYNLRFLYLAVIGEDLQASNTVFWCLCCLPLLLQWDKEWLRAAILILAVIITLITAKRSAVIVVAAISLCYVAFMFKYSILGRGKYWVLIVGCVVVYWLVSTYFHGSFVVVLERFRGAHEDLGSGRLDIYRDVISVIDNWSFEDWIVGRGFNSILTDAHHTNAHNDALQVLFEFGIIGISFYVIQIVFLINRLLFFRRQDHNYYLGYMVSLIIFVVMGAVSNLVIYYTFYGFLCAYWGIAENQYKKLSAL